VASTIGAATAFLYTGTNRIQTGVADGTIDPARVVVLRGQVMNRNGSPLPGITISILNHSEFGQTMSRDDGMFDLAVNGGGVLTVNYAGAGVLPAQRQVQTPWQEFVIVPDVALIPLDTRVTPIDLDAAIAMQVARGTPVTDADGTRRATLMFPEGMTAELVMPDGSLQAISSLNVRATEYTVGDIHLRRRTQRRRGDDGWSLRSTLQSTGDELRREFSGLPGRGCRSLGLL
ncbi:MAG: hypothetical protein JRG89_24880, partial [Deltaproteobacteria bacterium]|nr:hypothetical protein [Deltaproteobacteria bacterium]